jgi:hypothetical protein
MPSAETDTPDPGAAINRAPIGTREFVALIASLMAMGALGIDSMLPALPAIRSASRSPITANTSSWCSAQASAWRS